MKFVGRLTGYIYDGPGAEAANVITPEKSQVNGAIDDDGLYYAII